MQFLKAIFAVGFGSCIGGVVRYLISVALKNQSQNFPVATFIVNILGCLLIGICYGFATRIPAIPKNIVLLLTTGICGGFTTFSTFANESLQMINSQSFIGLIFYISASVILGIAMVFCGYWISNLNS